jgi:hypothetical protein
VKWIYLAFKQGSDDFRQKLPPLELDVLLESCCESALIRAMARRLLRSKKRWDDAENELMVARNQILDIYCLTMYRKLMRWSMQTPPYRKLALDELDALWLRALQLTNRVRPSPCFSSK